MYDDDTTLFKSSQLVTVFMNVDLCNVMNWCNDMILKSDKTKVTLSCSYVPNHLNKN